MATTVTHLVMDSLDVEEDAIFTVMLAEPRTPAAHKALIRDRMALGARLQRNCPRATTPAAYLEL